MNCYPECPMTLCDGCPCITKADGPGLTASEEAKIDLLILAQDAAINKGKTKKARSPQC